MEIPGVRTFASLIVLLGLGFGTAASRAETAASPPAPDYDYTAEARRASGLEADGLDPDELREVFSRRRERVLGSIPDGAMLVFSVERAQPRRLEFQVPHSGNHDFIYLTGVEGLDSLDSALLLVPGAETPSVVLYTSADIDQIRAFTGIEQVRAYARLEEDLSVALTDYRDWRITQIRRWPLSAALARRWGPKDKVLYLNYPRFMRVGMPEPPRLAFFSKLRRFSPELRLRDAADVLDPIRMRQDAYGLVSLRRAIEITAEGLVEGLSALRPGLREKQVMEAIDFVYRYRGARLGFPTGVRRQPTTGRPPERQIPEGFIQFVPRSAEGRLEASDIVHVDTGAAFNHYSADVQRSVPVSGKFSPEGRRLYEITLRVQKAVISRVKPGVTWWQLHDLAVEMLREAGGYDEHYTYGIGHFIGMEVHEEGDYERPLEPGMVLAIEQGVAPPGGPRVALEDDVLVTEDGHEWLTRSIPIEVDEVEAMLTGTSTLQAFIDKK